MALCESALSKQKYEAEIMKMKIVLQSKSGTRTSLTALHSSLLTAQQFDQASTILTQLMDVIRTCTELEEQLLNLQNKQMNVTGDGGASNHMNVTVSGVASAGEGLGGGGVWC